MKEITNYREFNQDEQAPSMRSTINQETIVNKNVVLDYMKSFEENIVCPCRIRDEITGEIIEKTLVYYTGGEFIWDEREIYHFECYNIKLEKTFIDKVLLQKDKLF